ncbi:MAG: hypothetical protein IT495_17115 [Gammaproteobacteria bacterium]|nr:hypothetical protein [Gammaproteobacteria bacterium]
MSAAAPATIGRCEWCGLVDHHLVEAACARCRSRSEDWPAEGRLGASARAGQAPISAVAPRGCEAPTITQRDVRGPQAGLVRARRKLGEQWCEVWVPWLVP